LHELLIFIANLIPKIPAFSVHNSGMSGLKKRPGSQKFGILGLIP